MTTTKAAVYESTGSTPKNKALAAETVTALTVHAQIEALESDGEMFVAHGKVLSECVKHHVKEAQNEMFP